MTYFFETYGCQMNIAESAATEHLFIARGWTKAESVQTADLVVINTCSVRATAENRIFGRLGYFAGLKALRAGLPGAKSRALEDAADFVKDGPRPLILVVMGCMAERLLHTLKKDWPCIDYVVGTFAKKNFGAIITAAENSLAAQTDCPPVALDNSPCYEFAPLSLEPGAFSSFVPVMHGCNNFCTYCIVPHVRGREVSRPAEQILSELAELSDCGVKEITLLGQNVNSYREPFYAANFPVLLHMICRYLEHTDSPIKWVRFVSSHPKDFSDELINTIAEEERLCRHIHLPVQHGSSRILERMNRRYTREHYLALVQRIRERIPGVSLTTDIMLGFPGESEEDFAQAYSLMQEVCFDNAFMYYYNPREGTPAAGWPEQLELEVKKARLQKIIGLQRDITHERMQQRLGRIETVLAEGISRGSPGELLGKTEHDERVVFAAPQDMAGRFVKVRLDELAGNTFRGVCMQ